MECGTRSNVHMERAFQMRIIQLLNRVNEKI